MKHAARNKLVWKHLEKAKAEHFQSSGLSLIYGVLAAANVSAPKELLGKPSAKELQIISDSKPNEIIIS